MSGTIYIYVDIDIDIVINSVKTSRLKYWKMITSPPPPLCPPAPAPILGNVDLLSKGIAQEVLAVASKKHAAGRIDLGGLGDDLHTTMVIYGL